jgi:hypothetical protein
MDLVVDLVVEGEQVPVILELLEVEIPHQHHHHKEILVEMVLVEQIQIMLVVEEEAQALLEAMPQTQVVEMVEQELHQQ